MCRHVVLKIRLANKRLRAVFTFEWFRCAIGMYPRVYLQIPFGGEGFIANCTVMLCVHRMCGHVCLNGGLGKGLLTQRALHRFGVIELIGVRQTNVAAQRVRVHEAITTVWTTFWLGIVRLFVPEEARLRWQHLTAMANIFLLPYDLLAVTLAMLR